MSPPSKMTSTSRFAGGVPCPLRRLLVNQARLHPDCFRAARDRLVHDAGDSRRIAEDVHDFQRLGNFTQRRIALPSEDLGAVITGAADAYCPKFRGLVS